MKTQILMIHGGMTFKNQKDYLHYLKTRRISLDKEPKWSDGYIDNELGRDFQIIRPRMPLQDNAKYRDWAIYFKRHLPLLKQDFVLIGRSLGGTFLAKFLSENRLPRRALATYLVCPPFDNTCPDEDLAGGFRLKSDLSLIEENTRRLCLMFSKDDNSVPISHAEKYRRKLKNAKIFIYNSKNGHFQISKFPEIIKDIKSLK